MEREVIRDGGRARLLHRVSTAQYHRLVQLDRTLMTGLGQNEVDRDVICNPQQVK
jgi:hypothetical protein